LSGTHETVNEKLRRSTKTCLTIVNNHRANINDKTDQQQQGAE